MERNFLPKALDKDAHARICLDIQSGEFSTDLHWHDCFEIIHIAKGGATVVFDGTPFEMGEGDSYFVPTERIHRCICPDASSRRVVVGIEVGFLFGGEPEVRKNFLPRYTSGCEEYLLFRGSRYPEIAESMSALSQISDTERFSSRLAAEAEIMRAYSLMYAEWERAGLIPSDGGEDATVRKIEDYIRENATGHITAESTAKHFNISYSYMAKLLSKYSPFAFSELLSNARVDLAKKMLIASTATVTEIGVECGFSDTSYFISSFKRRTGVTPRAYRTKK